MKIAVLIPYFGKWPSYFNVFLKGCAANPWLDVLIFTDCQIPINNPSNVHFFPSSLREISELIQRKINVTVNIRFSYKLCDLKPFYGKIFEDHLTNYDFWGYSDIDLIYGNLRPFILPRILEGFDILSSRAETMCGSFSILRNDPVINNLYKQIIDFPTLLKSNKCEALDENCWSNITWQGESKLKLPKTSFTYITANAHENGSAKVSFLTICKEHIGPNEKILYENNQLTFNGQEVGYYHFICNKSKAEFTLPEWQSIPDAFYITSSGFYSPSDHKLYRVIHTYRKAAGMAKRIKNKILRLAKD